MMATPWLVDGMGWLSLVGFVPLLILQHERVRRFGWWAALCFVVWILASCWWVGMATSMAFFFVPAVGLVFLYLPFMFWHRVTSRATAPVKWTLFVSMWIVVEAAYSYGDISFPWLTLGNAFASSTSMVQWYEYTGVFGGTLWVLVCNLLMTRAVLASRAGFRWRLLIPFWVVFHLPIVLSHSILYLQSDEELPTLKVAIVQPNIDPYGEKFEGLSYAQQIEIILSLASQAPSDVDYIVAPETALSAVWEHDFEGDRSVALVREFMGENYPDASMVIGASTYKLIEDVADLDYTTHSFLRGDDRIFYRGYNSALWIDSSSMVDVYHKSKLVCGVELLPYPAFFSVLSDLISVDLGGFSGNLGRSHEREVFDGVGTAICYEALYSEFYTEYVAQGAEAMFIISNDGWWGDTPGYRGLLNISRLRAIETRRAVARSANTGISAIIDSRGEVLDSLGWDQRGLIVGEIPLSGAVTFYVRGGDYIVRISFYTMLLTLLSLFALHFKRKNHLI